MRRSRATPRRSTAWWTWSRRAPGSVRPGDWIEHLDGPRDYAQQLWLDSYNRGDNGDVWPGWSAVNADTTDWSGPRDRSRFADDTIPPASDNVCDPTGVALENITLSGQDVTLDFVLRTKQAPRVDARQVARLELRDRHRRLAVLPQLRPPRRRPWPGPARATADSGSASSTPLFECGPGYGNNWYDFTWTTAGVSEGATITLRHRYDIEPDYDFAYVEGRCAGDPGAPWVQIAALTGASACVTDTWEIPSVADRRLRQRLRLRGAGSAAAPRHRRRLVGRGRQLLRLRLVGGRGGPRRRVRDRGRRDAGRRSRRAAAAGRRRIRSTPRPC